MDSSALQKFRERHPAFSFLKAHEIADDGGDSSNIGGLVKSLMDKTPGPASSQLGAALLKALADALPKIPSAPTMMRNAEDPSDEIRVGSMLLHHGVPVTVLHLDPDADVVTIRLPDGHVARHSRGEFTSTNFGAHTKAHGDTMHKRAPAGFTAGQRVCWKTNDNAPLSYGTVLEAGASDSMVEFHNSCGTSRALVPNQQLTAA